MRKIPIFLVISMLLTLIVSCGSETVTADRSTSELLESALSLYELDAGYEPVVYHSTAAEGSDRYIDLGYMSSLFVGEFDVPIPSIELVDEYSMAVNSSFVAFEIYVFKAKSSAAANEVKALMKLRGEQKEKNRGELMNYDPGQVEVLDNMEIYSSGKYVFLLATTDNSLAKAKFTELLGEDKLEIVTDTSETTTADTSKPSIAPDKIQNAASHVNLALSSGQSHDAKPLGENPSALPTLTVTSYSLNDHIVLGGSCVEGAKIHVRGGLRDMTFDTDYESWMVEVGIPKGEVTNLLVTQEEPGKDESAPITVTVRSRTDVDLSSHGVCQVAIGDDFQGHFYGQIEDWTGENILADNQLDGLTKRIQSKVDYLEGRDCELIYVIVPNPMTVYPETVPYRYVRSTADTTRTEQFETCAENAGATVIDLYDILTEHRDDEFKIFNKTDSHWTDYGAYFGYYALMEHIGKEYPDAKPLEIDGNFEFYNKVVDAGDMMTHLELENSLIKENATFGKFLIDAVHKPDYYIKGRNELDNTEVKDQKTIVNNISKGKLPTAMVLRDSFGTNIYPYLNNAFSEVYYQAIWKYQFDKSYIERTNPDYYIVIICERNIHNVLG